MSDVVDFTDFGLRNACPTCGGEAYLEANVAGLMRTRWRCEHDAALRRALDAELLDEDELVSVIRVMAVPPAAYDLPFVRAASRDCAVVIVSPYIPPGQMLTMEYDEPKAFADWIADLVESIAGLGDS